MEETAPYQGQPVSHLLSARLWKKIHSQEVDLAYGYPIVRLRALAIALPMTVARQHRTRTGFALQPSHPG